MTEALTVALATGGFTLGGILITGLFNHFGSASRNKKDKKININEERYNKVFSPIQKLIYFNQNDENLVNEVQTIIQDNFSLATDNLKQELKKSISDKALTPDFLDTIKIGCKCLENELGYTNEKLTKEEKKATEDIYAYDLARKKSRLFIISIITFSLSVILLLILLYYKDQLLLQLTENFLFSVICIIVAVMIFSFAIFTLMIFDDN